uniref:Putative conserved secreted protein n=1 Tax=Ixodes ricinus TaxID=34613 RepID=A0A6B0U5K4_IXORI
MLPISKMELVVFAVVLILPALLRGGFLSGTEMNDCMEILADCGEMKCLLEGSGKCTSSVREDLRNLRQKLEHAIYLVLSERCPSFSN